MLTTRQVTPGFYRFTPRGVLSGPYMVMVAFVKMNDLNKPGQATDTLMAYWLDATSPGYLRSCYLDQMQGAWEQVVRC